VTALYGEERDRAARVAKAALDAGVAERQIVLAERWGRRWGSSSKGFSEICG
jgi:hypothetical protein